MSVKIIGRAVILAFLMTGVAFAEDKLPEPKKEDKAKVTVNGKIFSEYKWGLNKGDNEDHGFAIKRGYVTVKGKIVKNWKVKITMDAGQVEDTGDNETNTYTYYLKNAYTEGTLFKSGGMKLKAKFGMIGTPIIGIADKMSDYRWIYNNYIDKAKELIGNHSYTMDPDGVADSGDESTYKLSSIDSSADLGASLMLDTKMVDVTLAITNGDGYKHVDESFKGKALYGLVTVNPIKALFINLFTRYETYAAGELTEMFYGGGIGYKTGLIKVGVNALMYTKVNDKDESDADQTATILDAWLHANLDSVIKLPILIVGRWATGSWAMKAEVNGGEEVKADDTTSHVLAGGLGWKFNKHVRITSYYEYKYVEKGDNTHNFYIKSETKF